MYKDLMDMKADEFQNELGKILIQGFVNSSLEHQIYTMLAAYACNIEEYKEYKTPEEAILDLIDSAQTALESYSDDENKNFVALHNFEMLKQGFKQILSNYEVKNFGVQNG
jgi:hypothetical protein